MEIENWVGNIPKNSRLQLKQESFNTAIDLIEKKLECRQLQKGMGTFASGHEALGVIIEEVREFQAEVEVRNQSAQIEELIDIAVGCIWAIASISSGGHDW